LSYYRNLLLSFIRTTSGKPTQQSRFAPILVHSPSSRPQTLLVQSWAVVLPQCSRWAKEP